MTEEQARAWLLGHGVSRETMAQFAALKRAVVEEAHNLVARSTVDHFISRHVVDSIQLAHRAPSEGLWIDVGSGGGFPGLPIAMVRAAPMILIEPRRLRADFLSRMCAQFALDHVTVMHANVEQVSGPVAAVVSARAVAQIARLFDIASHLSERHTRWILPRGRSASEEVETAFHTWQYDVKMVPSVTQEQSMIVIADRVCAKRGIAR